VALRFQPMNDHWLEANATLDFSNSAFKDLAANVGKWDFAD
jgi:hypothetical protein